MEKFLSLESNHMLVNGIWCSNIWVFHTLFKELYWTVFDYFVAVHGLCVWPVCRQFPTSSEAGLWPSLWLCYGLFLQLVYGHVMSRFNLEDKVRYYLAK